MPSNQHRHVWLDSGKKQGDPWPQDSQAVKMLSSSEPLPLLLPQGRSSSGLWKPAHSHKTLCLQLKPSLLLLPSLKCLRLQRVTSFYVPDILPQLQVYQQMLVQSSLYLLPGELGIRFRGSLMASCGNPALFMACCMVLGMLPSPWCCVPICEVRCCCHTSPGLKPGPWLHCPSWAGKALGCTP